MNEPQADASEMRPREVFEARSPVRRRLSGRFGKFRDLIDADVVVLGRGHRAPCELCKQVMFMMVTESLQEKFAIFVAAWLVRTPGHSSRSSAVNCGAVNAIRPVVVVGGQTNWPRSSFFVSMHRPMPSCQSSLISPAQCVS
jgi:hypothetical protein